MKNIKICEENSAISFLKENKANKESIFISSSSQWFAFYLDKKIIGVISVLKFKKTTRIKSFYVKKEFRKKGIGNELIQHILNNNTEYSVYATEKSYNLFIKNGFKEITKIKNIKFLKRGLYV